MSRFVRAETPPNFDDYRKYRPFLRRDFRHLCAYCERSEAGLGGEEFFEIDHFRPRKFLDLITHYPNLYYACRRCNVYKSGTWPSDELLARGFRFSDPCQEDMYLEHFRESPDGTLEAQTSCGQYTRNHIRLNRSDLLRWRQLRREMAVELRRLEGLKNLLGDMLTVIKDTSIKDDIREHLTAIEAMMVRGREQFSL